VVLFVENNTGRGTSMPKVKFVEKTIFSIEGFEVDIIYNGKNVRDDASLPSNYIAGRMTKNSATVAEWREKFKKQFPGYDVNVKKMMVVKQEDILIFVLLEILTLMIMINNYIERAPIRGSFLIPKTTQ
jgi:hypothetical protein